MLGENLATKTITATTAQTITFNDSEISNDHIGVFIANHTGANNALDNALTNVRVRVGGQPCWDVTGPILRSVIEAIAPASTIPAVGRLTVSLPLALPAMTLRGFDGTIGLPAGSKPSVDFVYNASSSAGTVKLGWDTLASKSQFYTRLISFAGNVPASQTNQYVQLNVPDGLIYGLNFPLVSATGITQLRVVIGGVEIMGLADQGVILESQFMTNPQTVTTNLFWRCPVALPATIGNSFCQTTTGAASAATDAYAYLSLHPVK
jgi:hypothetical protein